MSVKVKHREFHPNSVVEVMRGQFNLAVADITSLSTGDLLLSDPGLAIGTDKTKIAHGALVWQIDGARFYLAAGEKAFTATTHDIADPDTDPREAIFVISVPVSASAVTITKGTTAADGEAVAPATPAGHVKLGELLLAHDGSAIFDATTDELDAAHLTATFTDATVWAPTCTTVVFSAPTDL